MDEYAIITQQLHTIENMLALILIFWAINFIGNNEIITAFIRGFTGGSNRDVK